MRYYNEKTGQEQSSPGGPFDAHIKPIPSTQEENNRNTALLIIYIFLLIGAFFKYSWDWSKFVVRNTGGVWHSWIVAIVLFVFHMIFPWWAFAYSTAVGEYSGICFICFIDVDQTGPRYFQTLHPFLGYFIVMTSVIFYTICGWLALSKDVKQTVYIKNMHDRQQQTFLSNPSVLVTAPISYMAGKHL